MTRAVVFISYKHDEPWSDMAAKLHLKLENAADDLGFEVYIDKTMVAGEEWSDELRSKLAQTSHFIALLCDPYWASDECKKELFFMIDRYEAAKAKGERAPRLLFVRAGELKPANFSLNKARKSGQLKSTDPRIQRLGDLNFLGPYDLKGNGQLEILDWDSKSHLDKQLGQLRDRLEKTLTA